MDHSLGLPTLDPTHFTALWSADFGSMFSPDGRDHPVTGYTPISAQPPTVDTPATTASACDQYSVGSAAWQKCLLEQGSTTAVNGSFLPSSGADLFSKLFPTGHIVARGVMVIIGVGIILIVAARLTRG